MHILNKKFEKIFVIGFKNSTRMNNFEKIFDFIDYELIDAINGDSVSGISDLKPRRSPECRLAIDKFYNEFEFMEGRYKAQQNLTTREAACCLSHIKANQIIIKNNYNNVLILEDDVMPTAGIELIEKINLNFDFDILMLNQTLSSEFGIARNYGDVICSYVVKNKTSANKYIHCFKNGLMCADHPMSNPNMNLNVFSTTKPLFFHDPKLSIINDGIQYK
jgi:hypothetical protein